MKKHAPRYLLFIAATLMASAMCAQLGYAQAPAQGDKSEMIAKLEKMSTELQLTPAQKQQILPILKEEAPKLQAVKANTSLGPLQKGMQLKQISNDTDTKLKPILTPEQFQKLQQMHEQERQQMMQKMEQK
jgi:Spy/CpxP family protein refolding chaperone